MRCIDLFSGLGGFSQAFLDRGHDVIRYDNDIHFEDVVPHTIMQDIAMLTADDLKGADIVLASPPCQHFSIAAVCHHWKDLEPTEETQKIIRLVKHTKSIIEEANPKYYIIENPRGMMRRVLGMPDKFIFLSAYGKKAKKPTDLWGRLPPVDWKQPFRWEKAPRGSKTGVQGYKNAAEASMIPYDFSLAVCLACEGISPQSTLNDFIETGSVTHT